MLQQVVKDRILKSYENKQNSGDLPSAQQLETYYRLFRQRFGPNTLSGLDGEPLLNLMYDLGNRDSLVYWLEYKNDAEFPAIFGSIAGGSALKYGIFRRRETGAWTIGSPQKQVEISVAEAIEIARRNWDQLMKGVFILQNLPDSSEDAVYFKLQEDLHKEAPGVQDSLWGHKYFHLLFPEKLDTFHMENLQQFHLIKLLQMPPEKTGRYTCAGRFVALARECGLSMNILTTVLNDIDGRLYRYWRMGTHGGEDNRSYWSEMEQGSYVSIGWDKLGDLSWLEFNKELKEKFFKLVLDKYKKDPAVTGGTVSKIFNFVVGMQEGDIVLGADGRRIQGVGRVVGGYEYQPNGEFPHHRQVEWLTLDPWELPQTEGLQFAIYAMKKPENLIAIEERLLQYPGKPRKPFIESEGGGSRRTVHLEGISGRIQAVLDRKKQIILYGPPGTGKTYWANRTAKDLGAYSMFGKSFSEIIETEKQKILGKFGEKNGVVRRCTFHPAYGYEDFIEGYRPVSTNGQLSFEKRSGIFKTICEDAQKNPNQPYYLIIDEINRGDLPRIFGELLTLLEKDKRGQSIILPLNGDLFQVPENVFVIGTMNTADRSIALLDTALRRRFGFLELMPDSSLLNLSIEGLPLGPWLDALNERIRTHIGKDARNLQIGHAYFFEGEKPINDKLRFVRVLREDILPLLEEYCYEDYDNLSEILGDQIVDAKSQRFREEVLSPERWDQLLIALLGPNREVTTSKEVIQTQQNELEDQLDEDTLDVESN